MEPDEQALRAWVDEDFALRVAVKCEDGQWYALLMDFDITGCGPTLLEAVHDAFGLLGAYLEAFYAEGAQFSQSLRPIPLSLRMRIRLESAAAGALRSVHAHTRLAREETYAMPLGLVTELAAAC